MIEYTYETYGMARFHVPEGMYSVDDLEQLIKEFREAEQIMDEQALAATQPMKTRSQKIAEAGYKRRPSAKSLPSDE